MEMFQSYKLEAAGFTSRVLLSSAACYFHGVAPELCLYSVHPFLLTHVSAPAVIMDEPSFAALRWG